nr:c1q globular head like domain containing protein [uncultured Mediterranean phage uvMED]
MSYIGTAPTIGNFQVCDAISTVNGQASYTMQVSSVNVVPQSANHMLVSLNGILQKPNSSFTVSGSTITFASNLVTGDVIDFIQILGSVLDLGVPSDNTVSLAKLTATGTKDATTFLRGDNTFAEVPAGGITVADQWRVTANITANADPISSNLERIDTAGQGTIGTAMSVSSGRFTFPSTGIYLVSYNAFGQSASGGDNIAMELKVTTNNSSYTSVSTNYCGDGEFRANSISGNSLIDVTDTSNVKVSFAAVSIDSGSYFFGDTTGTSQNETYFTFIRLGDT